MHARALHASRPHYVYIQGEAERADQLHLHQNKHVPNDFWAKDRLSLAPRGRYLEVK